MRYSCVYFGMLLGLASGVASAARIGSLHGELVCDECKVFLDLSVEVQEMNNRIGTDRTSVASNGAFELHNIEEGNYLLSVVNSRGVVLKREMVNIHGQLGSISVRVEPESGDKPGTGTVSISQLKHKPPSKAVRDYERAQARFEKGDLSGSAESLERAIALDPEYMEAHNNLGSRYMLLGKIDQALVEFRRAAELDSNAQLVLVNLAVALLHNRQFAEAEKTAREAMRLVSNDVKSHYVLGIALYAQRRYTPETVESLQRASREFSAARLPLAHLLAVGGNKTAAKEMLEAYLKGPEVEKRAEAERLLLALR